MKIADQQEPEVRSFKTAEAFEKWLAAHHSGSAGIWLRFFKKGTDEKAVTYQEALDEALCHGWIDGQMKKYDDKSWVQKFTPRGPRSVWSKRNTHHAERLVLLGKMKPAGLAEIEKAKADGRWEKAYDSPAAMTMPDDFMDALSCDKNALAFFESLNKANKYAIGWRLQTAKKPDTREKRMKAILAMLSKGEKFH